MPLTALQIKHAKEGMHADGSGLYLLVSKAGAKSWIFRYQINGRRREMGLGGAGEKSAVQARAEVGRLRADLAEGIDPLEAKKQIVAENKVKAEAAKLRAVTFEDASLKYIEAHKAGWSNEKHAWQWENSLSLYAFPFFGSLPVADVTTEHVLAGIEPIWVTKTETATRVRQRIEKILDYARFNKWRTGENPARWTGHLEHTLPKPGSVRKVAHQPALPYKRMAEFMAELRTREGAGARGLEFAILTASRSGEVRGARWSEIDMEAGVWTVPAERMKSRKEHRVPLSARALRVLEVMPRMADEDLIFPGTRSKTLMSDMTLKATVVRINRDREKAGLSKWTDATSGVPVVPHGFRSTFRDWAAEVTHYPGEMAEMALAHTVPDRVEAAYRRGTMFEKRRQMMVDWAAWCDASNATVLAPVLANAA